MSELTHDEDERNITASLIDQSDLFKYKEHPKAEKVGLTINDWSDAVVGWKSGQTNQKASNSSVPSKKKRPVERSFTDLNYGNISNQGDNYWSNSSGLNGFKQAVRCVGDDFQTYPIPPWKSNIEQGTYRYIPDNGSYRTLKFMCDDRKEWFTIRKKLPEKVSATWHQNCKRMHREMRRQLRKDMQHLEKDKASPSVRTRNSSRTSGELTSGEESSRSVNEKVEPGVNEPKEKENVKFEPQTKQIYRREARVKSTQSDGAVNHVKKMKTIHESEPPTPMPPQYSIPSNTQLFKSASDLFIENFSSRIKNLEDEIKQDSKWLRKNEGDTGKQPSRQRHRDPRIFKESHSVNTTPRYPVKTETLTSDIFSVKSVSQKELRPLEKTKGFNKTSTTDSNNTTNSATEAGTINEVQNGLSSSRKQSIGDGVYQQTELDKTLENYKSSFESTKQVLFNALTGTKINATYGKRHSKGFSSPATITICDNNQSTSQSGSHMADPFRQVPIIMDKKSDRKGSIQSIPAVLPEISGKRMEVTNIPHRLL